MEEKNNIINDNEGLHTVAYTGEGEPELVEKTVVAEPQLFNAFSAMEEEKAKKLLRKREIKRLSNAVALPLIGFNIVGFIASLIVQIVVLIVLGLEQGEALLTNSDFQYLYSGMFSILYFSLPFLLIGAMTKTRLRDTVAFGRCRIGKAVPVIMLGFGVIAVTQYASVYFSTFLSQILGQPVENPLPEYGTGPMSLVINLVCIGLIPAIMEEFAFRGVILGTTRRFASDGFAIIVNATLFSMLHGNLHQIPFTFAFGLFLAYMTVYTGSVVPAMVVHGVNNSLSVIVSMVTDNASGLVQILVTVSYYVVLLFVGIFGLILFINSSKDPLKLSKERSEDTKTVAANYFSSAGFIIFAIMTLMNVLDAQYNITARLLGGQ